LRPAVEAYLLTDLPMTVGQVAAMRAYLRQWIEAPDWLCVDDLRAAVNGLHSRERIDDWLARALEVGIDPL